MRVVEIVLLEGGCRGVFDFTYHTWRHDDTSDIITHS